jgi:hypothetical protein
MDWKGDPKPRHDIEAVITGKLPFATCDIICARHPVNELKLSMNLSM